MSAEPPSLRRRRTTARRLPVSFLVVNAVFVAVLHALGALVVWPIYGGPWFAVTATAAFALSLAVAALGLRRSWSAGVLALLTAGVYAVVALPLAAPSSFASGDAALRGLVSVLTAPVTGWKDVLTLELPLGSYQATLAPALLLMLAVGVSALSLAWRAARLWVLAPPIALVLTAWGVLFGSSALSGTARLGPVSVVGPVETALAVAAVLVSLGFYVWRSIDARGRALRIAEAASGVRSTGTTGSAAAGRVGIAVAMVVVATVAGVAVAPLAVAGHARDVLRTRVDPRLELVQHTSPLAHYRSYFSDEAYDRVLFTVEADAPVDRVRLAALPFYDGQVARVVDPTAAGDQRTAFARVPSTLTAAPGTDRVEVRVTIGAYDRPWLPLVGSLGEISFDGPPALTDGFFYNRETRTGVELSPLAAGVSYRQTGAVESALPALTALTHDGASRVDPAVVPPALVEWMRLQKAGSGGAALSTLIERLRARGFLSHGLMVDPEAPPLWLADREGAFQPSRAGHSSDRIDQLFRALIDRESEIGGSDDAQLVAAVGDDEQFAVAAALIADQLGFPVRVVLGARLTATGDGTPACEAGVCRGRDMTAWIEVQDAEGPWVPVDVTPQSDAMPFAQDQQRNDPENPTDVEAENATIIPPVDANPTDSGEGGEDDPAVETDLGPLWAALRIAGLSLLGLLVLLSPALTVLVVKLVRRRSRRRAAAAADRVTGGWEEYVDVAVDHGLTAAPTATRSELAAHFAGGDPAAQGALLAAWADRAVFDEGEPAAGIDEQFWQLVGQERDRFRAQRGWWGRLRARLSLRSLVRRPRHRRHGRPRTGRGGPS